MSLAVAARSLQTCEEILTKLYRTHISPVAVRAVGARRESDGRPDRVSVIGQSRVIQAVESDEHTHQGSEGWRYSLQGG